MKKIVKIVILSCAVVLASCAPKAIVPKATMVPPVAPKVEMVTKQAKVASVQSNKTVELAKVVEEKYKKDPDVTAVVESAKETEIQNKETEFQLKFLEEYAKTVDIKAVELTKESEQKDVEIAKKEIEVVKQKEEIKKVENIVAVQKAKISSKNGFLAAAGLIILLLLGLILKPWRWI